MIYKPYISYTQFVYIYTHKHARVFKVLKVISYIKIHHIHDFNVSVHGKKMLKNPLIEN
jgi:hypothetical protein